MKSRHIDSKRCISCEHFRNSPKYMENVFKGMKTMSSAYASVRKDDGICLLHDIYLEADNWCAEYTAALTEQEAAAERG